MIKFRTSTAIEEMISPGSKPKTFIGSTQTASRNAVSAGDVLEGTASNLGVIVKKTRV